MSDQTLVESAWRGCRTSLLGDTQQHLTRALSAGAGQPAHSHSSAHSRTNGRPRPSECRALRGRGLTLCEDNHRLSHLGSATSSQSPLAEPLAPANQRARSLKPGEARHVRCVGDVGLGGEQRRGGAAAAAILCG